MRFRLYVLLCVFALGSSWAQDATAGDSAPPSGQSAYDIFGISPVADAPPASGDAAPVLVQDTGAAAQGDTAASTPVTEENAIVEPTAVPAVEPAVTPVAEPLVDAVSSDEEVLMAEIMRLLAERDTLYQMINDLQAENKILTEAAADADYYRNRSGELEAEIAALQEALAQKELQLADADSRLLDSEARLSAAGGDSTAIDSIIAAKDAMIAEKDSALASRDETIASLDARIAAAEKDLKDAKAALEAAKASEEAARTAAAAPVPPIAGQAATSEAVAEAERKVAEIAAERDAALALRDAAIATRDASDSMRKAAEQMLAETEAALAAAKASGAVVPAAMPAAVSGYLAGWKLDTSLFMKSLRAGFDGSAARMGAWKISGGTAAQTDASQYFSRLEMPLAQGSATTLYRFKARSTGSGWIGLGLHIYVEDNKKKRGYGEGKSLLVWFTRDRAARGDNATYLQLYRSDDDVVMERMFDAELEDGIESWRLVEVVYDPGAEYIAISVDGILRIVYRTFFGRDSGATVSLRTLGGGCSFSDFSAWTE